MKVRANAKVNLSLDITGRRDDGYHTLCSCFQSVSLCDVIELTPASEISVGCSINDLLGSDNLCFKAAQLFFAESGIGEGVRIDIEKHIPVAAGLGGGSADAAAVLVALNKMYGQPLSEDRLLEIALSLGADVPFCVMGGTVLAEGIGEEMTKLPDLPHCYTVVAKKGFKSSTKDMYAAIDSTEPERVSDVDGIVFSLLNGDLETACKAFYNRFEEVTERSVLNECRSIMQANGCLWAGLSGAGPSVVGIFEADKCECAKKAVMSLKENGFEAYLCEPAPKGVEIIE